MTIWANPRARVARGGVNFCDNTLQIDREFPHSRRSYHAAEVAYRLLYRPIR
jgi:hypothetical protein